MITSPSRRHFTIALAALGSGKVAFAQAGAHVAETDEQAIALGYHQDSKKVEAAKYPKYAQGQHCGNCSFWQGKSDDAWAGCAMFGRKHVAHAGWCQVWAKVPG